MDQSDPYYLPPRFLLDLSSKDGWLLLPRKSRQPWIKSLVVPPDVQPFPPSFLLLLYSDLLFGFAAKVILGSDTARDVYEMEPPMDEAHKQGITIWSDVSISFFSSLC